MFGEDMYTCTKRLPRSARAMHARVPTQTSKDVDIRRPAVLWRMGAERSLTRTLTPQLQEFCQQ